MLYVKGDKNVVADALSRRLILPEEGPIDLPCENWPHAVAVLCRQPSAADPPAHGAGGPGRVAVGAPDGHESVCVLAVARAPPAWRTREHAADTERASIRSRQIVTIGGHTRGRAARSLANPAGAVGWGEEGAAATSTGTWLTPQIVRGEGQGRHGAGRLGAPDAPQPTSGQERAAAGRSERPRLDRRRGLNTGARHLVADMNGVRFAEYTTILAPGGNHLGYRTNGSGGVGKISQRNLAERRVALRTSDTHFVSNPTPMTSPVQGGSDDLTAASKVPSVVDRQAAPSQPDPGGEATFEDARFDQSSAQYERLLVDLFGRVREALLTDEGTQTEDQRRKRGLVERDGLYWRNEYLLYIPDDKALRQDVLYWHHDVPWCAHLGIQKSVELVRRQFWWPSLKSDVVEYVSSCHKCQANKTDRVRRRPPLTPLVPPDACWRTMGVDLIVDLPVSADGYDAICVFVDHLSSMVRLAPTDKSMSTEGFARLFFREVFPHYGMPARIVSDRGQQWNSKFFKALCNEAHTDLSLSTAYHPQTNGLVERMNEVVSAALRHYVSADTRDWVQWLPFVEFAINNTYREKTKCTAYQMNRVTLPRNPAESVRDYLLGDKALRSDSTTWMGTPEARLGAATWLHAQANLQFARKCIEVAQQRMKAQYDGRGVNRHLYELGDLVWFSNKNLGITHSSRRHKLVPKYTGPVKIIRIISNTAVELDLAPNRNVHPVVSTQLLKPYRPRVGEVAAPVIIDEAEEWILNAVTGHHVVKSRKRGGAQTVEFRAKWKGSYEDSWHEFADFENSRDSIERYLSSCNKKALASIFAALRPEDLELLSDSVRKRVR